MAKKQEFQVYNSMTKQKEVFKPKIVGKVGMYVCGVTAYDFSHIGHARAYVAFDVLYRYLKHLGYEVVYVRNFTDVDDKIIRRANELGEDALALSGRFCQEFLDDMADLQCLPPTHQPRVSDHMDQIKNMITQIISNGCAYPVDGDVYFSVDNSPNYGRLSGRKLEDNRAGERVAVDSRKKNPFDFALWKAAKPGEPSWDSPWGPGRPGWHIECSAMSAEYLTHTFDIHGGGMDLIFPHHENELAQSCAACPDTNVGYWLHNGFVTANDEKMSKSLGNFFTIREVTKLYHPLALRHFLMSTHYRSPVNYSISQLEVASEAVFYIYQTLQDCQDALSLFQDGSQKRKLNEKAKQLVLLQLLKNASFLEPAQEEAATKTTVSVVRSLSELEKEVKKVLDTLGLLSDSTYSEALRQLKERALKRAELTEDGILHLIEERASARKNKDFSRGDKIRSELASKGIALMDVGKETVWRPCVPVEQEQLSVIAEQPQPCVLAQNELQVDPQSLRLQNFAHNCNLKEKPVLQSAVKKTISVENHRPHARYNPRYGFDGSSTVCYSRGDKNVS